MRPSSLTRFTYSALALALLVPLAGCGGNADANPEAEPSSARLTLTGPLQADGGFTIDCNIYSDRGLQVTFAQGGGGHEGGEEAAGESGHDLQIQVRINDYLGSGEYPVGIVINEHEGHGFKRWNGAAVANVRSRVVGGSGIQQQSEVSGSFEGTYTGQQGGQGTIRGTFQSCAMRELIP